MSKFDNTVVGGDNLFVGDDSTTAKNQEKGGKKIDKKSLNNDGFSRNIKSLKDIDYYSGDPVIDLVFPIKLENKVIDKVVIKKLFVSDIASLKKSIQRYDMSNSRNISMIYKFFDLLFSSSLERFLYEDGTAVNNIYNNRLIGALPINNVIRLLISLFLLNRESPYISTNYECTKCKTLNMFDIDPEDRDKVSPPDGEHHAQMENVFDFLREDYDIFDENLDLYEYRVHLQRPLDISFQGEKISIESISIEYPTLGLYNSLLSNPRKKDDFELWLLFESIKRINDFDEEKTNSFKRAVGIVEFFKKFDIKDFKKINENLFRDGISFEHSFVCMNCGHYNKTDMDLSNFFGFLLD